jgi:LPS-assembly protein
MYRKSDGSSFATLIISAVIIFHASSSFAAQEPSGEPIVVNGDNVEYFQEKQEVVGTGKVSIVYKDIVLTCDKITVNLATRDAIASGNVKVRQKDAYFSGDNMKYNFDTRQGEVTDGYLSAKPFYGRTHDLGKVAEKEEYTINAGYVTTCDLDHPHYRIQAKQVKIYINDKVVAKHVVFYVGNVPVFYIPYWVQPITEERKTHITVTPGQSGDWGWYVLTSYRYHISDRSRGDLLLDYRGNKGLAYGVNHYLDTREAGKGAFKFYYTKENAFVFKKDDPSQPEWSRYRWQYRHRWDMKDLDTSAIVEFNKLSDANVIKEYIYNEYEELGPTPDNYISVITAKKEYTTEFLIRFAPNYFYPVVERLPQYKIDILNYKIGDTNFYYNSTTSAAILNYTYKKAYPKQKDINTFRFDTYQELSYNARLFRALSVRPYAGIRETFYSRNRWGDTNLWRSMFPVGVDFSTKFYKIYDVETNFADLNIHKLRHIITPTASYYHISQPTIAPGNLMQYDSIDSYDTANGIRLGIENKVQTKRGTDGSRKSVDLATFLVTTDYQFRLQKDNWKYKENRFTYVDLLLELIPYSWLYATSHMRVNPKNCAILTADVDFVGIDSGKWLLASGLRYQKFGGPNDGVGTSNQITAEARYRLNNKWMFRAYERVDIAPDKMKWYEQQYTITRDLHCWVAELTFSFGQSHNAGVWLALKLKAFPDTPIGLKQTYSRPRFGEAGSSQERYDTRTNIISP